MSRRVEIIMWNVEHGAAIYVKTPNGRSILLDAGASTDFEPAYHLYKNHALERVDAFILSHADTDHIRDIEDVEIFLNPRVFSRNKSVPRDLVYPTYPPATNPLKYFHEFDARYSHPLEAGSPDKLTEPENWGGLRIESFHSTYPEEQFTKLNDYSMATFLVVW
jgi:ribonuclease BN (tRNA processing enzyme)